MLNTQKIVSVQLSTFVEKKSIETKPLPKPTPKPITQYKEKKKKVKKKKESFKEIVPKKELFKKVEVEKEKRVVEKVLEQNTTKEIEEKRVEVAQVSQKSEVLVPEIPQEKSVSAQEVYINQNIELIRTLIKENLYYPRSARKRGLQGKVIVKMVISKGAEPRLVQIVSSEHEILSRAAIKTIENIKPQFPKSTEELTLEIPIVYALK